MKMGGMCFNWKVLAGLAAVGLAVWLVAPNLVGAALPLLILAACPLSMLLMGRGMQGSHCSTPQQPGEPGEASQPTGVRLTRDEQLAELKAQHAILQIRQQALGREIAELEAANAVAVREAEAIARAADERVQHGA